MDSIIAMFQGNTSATFNYSWIGNEDDTVDLDKERAIQVFLWILVIGIVPVCFLGLAANVVSIWVWNANKKRIPVVLLFQCLGLADSVFLLLTAIRGILYYLDRLPDKSEPYMIFFILLSQSTSVHVTVAIGVLRWLGVARPHRMQRMKPCHVLVICGALGVWCGLLTAVLIILQETLGVRQTGFLVAVVVLQVFMFILPNVALLGFSISLLTCQRRWRDSPDRSGRMTVAVLSIAGCSLVSCLVGESGKFLLLLGYESGNGCNWSCAIIAFAVGNLFQVLNSSVNFVFYILFASTFRPLLWQTLCCCLGRSQANSRKSSTSPSVVQVTSDTGSVPQPGSTEQPAGEPLDKTAEMTEKPADISGQPANVTEQNDQEAADRETSL